MRLCLIILVSILIWYALWCAVSAVAIKVQKDRWMQLSQLMLAGPVVIVSSIILVPVFAIALVAGVAIFIVRWISSWISFNSSRRMNHIHKLQEEIYEEERENIEDNSD